MKYNTIAPDEIIQKTITSLKENGINAFVVENGKEAKAKALELIPAQAEIMNMTSVTLETIGIPKEINQSGRYNSVRNQLNSMDRKTQNSQMQKLGAAPVYAIGSVHAVTQEGQVVIASNTGSQLPAYAYGAAKVIWVVGAQKIVKDLDTAFKRIYEYVLPLESERARKAYGVEGSNVSKLLIVNKEIAPNRITIIFVKEVLGF
ncbi:MAG: LUD domain-containing protein [Candidatus Wildermuthbacteria bacterium]|nr:LUD domain-containing protein [Candidatus Wildermuthbacteria bacterium]